MILLEPEASGLPAKASPHLEHWPVLILWISHCLVCHRSVLSLANEACLAFILREISEKLLWPITFQKKVIVMSEMSWASAFSWLIALPQRNTVHRCRRALRCWRGPMLFFKLSRKYVTRFYTALCFWEILLLLFKNKLKKMEGAIKINCTYT